MRSVCSGTWVVWVFAIAWSLLPFAAAPQAAQTNAPVLLYSTHFEAAEGYKLDQPLSGQNGWVHEGSGGNGLISGFFDGEGQQAFIGFNPPVQKGEFLNVWRPINLAPINPSQPLVKFSVWMQIVASTNGHSDDFRWSLYNTNADRLFTLDFDNENGKINYLLDDNQFVPTGLSFDHGLYELAVYINFARNHWTALLNGVVLANSLPVTTARHALNFGDFDAVWVLHQVDAAGNNYMVFDNYQITLERDNSIPPVLQPLGLKNGEFNFRFFGEPGLNYGIEVSSDLKTWSRLGKYLAPTNGVFEFNDTTSVGFVHSFYRSQSF